VVREIARAGGVPAGLPANCASNFKSRPWCCAVHQDKTYPGAMVASLSVPWGNTKEEREGYHLVWPRDLVECAGALLAVGATREAGNTLRYLRATQLADGHWYQNQYLGGKPYWSGSAARRDGAAGGAGGAARRARMRSRARKSPTWCCARSPTSCVTGRRAIRTAGRRARASTPSRSPPALQPWSAVPITAGRCARARARFRGFLELALEDWTAVRDTPLARQFGIPGYYVRVAPSQAIADRGAFDKVLSIKNQAFDPGLPAAAQFGVDFLQLVRFGLRRPTIR
jgi:glucoamylase